MDPIIRSSDSSKNVILASDMDIDIKPNNSDKHSAAYLELTAELGFLPGHQYPTRTWTVWIIFVIDSTITDHALVLSNLSLTKPMPATVN